MPFRILPLGYCAANNSPAQCTAAIVDLPSGLIGSRLSLYCNGRGFESRQLQDIVSLNTLSISRVLTCRECVLC